MFTFSNKWLGYKWIIALSCCVTQLFTLGYVLGSMSILTLYYQDRFNERTLSSNIGAVQMAIVLSGGFPGSYLNRRIGERYTQCIAGILTVIGLLATAFTTQAWQTLLTSSVLHGAGSALELTAAYSMIAVYFPSHQLAMSAAMMVCTNLGEMLFPSFIDMLMQRLGFRDAFLVLACLNTFNILAGLTFAPKAKHEGKSDKDVESKRLTNFKISDRKSGIYHLPTNIGEEREKERFKLQCNSSDLFEDEVPPDNAGVSDDQMSTGKDRLVKENSRLSKVMLMESQNSEEYIDEPMTDDSTATVNSSLTTGSLQIFTDLASDKKRETTLSQILKNGKVINYLLAAVVSAAGINSFSSILGDFSRHKLKYNTQQLGYGLTLKGSGQLFSSLAFTLIAKHCDVSCAALYSLALTTMAGVAGALLFHPSTDVFYGVMILYGLARGMHLFTRFGVCLEITSPAHSVLTFMVENLACGIGVMTFPYLTAYVQVEVDIDAGMYAVVVMLCSSMAGMTYLVYQSLFKLKVYTQRTGRMEPVQPLTFGTTNAHW